MNQPQELEVWYLLPTIRKELVLSLKNLGLKNKEISNKLGITESAISQYIKNKRGNKCSLSNIILKNINISAKKIIENGNVIEEIQKNCDLAKKEKILCKIHKEQGFNIKNCNICIK
ncbi:transcriptional regulator [Candidatus Woesearchaeota archaeon]|nr:MAG: transcriptional regulator [Candidatus Woesearchaeota archaeon]